MPKESPARSNRGAGDLVHSAKKFEESPDIRRVRLPAEKTKDQFKLSFPERFMDHLNFNNSETFDKRMMQYRLSYAGSQLSGNNSVAQSHVQSTKTPSTSMVNSRPGSVRQNSKSATPTAKSGRKSPHRSIRKTPSRSASKVKETEKSQPKTPDAASAMSPSRSKDTGASRIFAPQSPQRTETLTPPASKQPSRQQSPRPHQVAVAGSNTTTAASLPPTNQYEIYKASLMHNYIYNKEVNAKRPASGRSNYNSQEYKQNLMLNHENSMHNRALNMTSDHVVLGSLASAFTTNYIEENISDKLFRNRRDIWESHKCYVKPWRSNMKSEEIEDIPDVEACIRKKITINEPVKSVTITSDADMETLRASSKSATVTRQSVDLHRPQSEKILEKYARNDTQRLYDTTEYNSFHNVEEQQPQQSKQSAKNNETANEDDLFIKRYSIQTIQWNRQYASLGTYKQDLEDAARKECLLGILKNGDAPVKPASPQRKIRASSVSSQNNFVLQLERYRVSAGDMKEERKNEYAENANTDQNAHLPSPPQQRYRAHSNQAPSTARRRVAFDGPVELVSRRASSKPHSNLSAAPKPSSSRRPDSNVRLVPRPDLVSAGNRRPQSAAPKPSVPSRKGVRLPSASSTVRGKQSGLLGSPVRPVSGSHGMPLANRNRRMSDSYSLTGRGSVSADGLLGVSAPEVDIHKSLHSLISVQSPTASTHRPVAKVPEGRIVLSPVPATAVAPEKIDTPQISKDLNENKLEPVSPSERSPYIREYKSHVQPYKDLITDVEVSKTQLDQTRAISPILFSNNLTITPHIGTSRGKSTQKESHSRILNELSSDLQNLVNTKREKASKLPPSIIDPHEIFPLSPAGVGDSQKDSSIDIFVNLPQRSGDLGMSSLATSSVQSQKRMMEDGNRNVVKLYYGSPGSPSVPINSSMLRESKGTHAYAIPDQPLAIHDNTADDQIIARSQELTGDPERSSLLSSAIQQALSAKPDPPAPAGTTLQAQLYNVLTRKVAGEAKV